MNINTPARVALIATATLAMSLPAFAATISASASLDAKGDAPASINAKAETTEQRIAKTEAKGLAEIDARIDRLNKLTSRIGQMTRVSDTDRASLSLSLQNEISLLTALKAKLPTDTSTTSIKADVSSITGAYRIYALVIPQTNIIAAADRELTIADMINAVGTKIDARLATYTGSDASSLATARADIKVKTADAAVNAQAAIDAVKALVPDQGDKAKLAANTAALKAARVKIQTAQTDLKAARKDVQTIVKALVKGDMSLTASTTVSH